MNFHKPSFRPANQSDVIGIETCVAQAYNHYTKRIGKTPGPMLDDYSQIVKDHKVFVAEEANQIIGVAVLIRKEGGLLLDNIAVLPKFQKIGIGRKLIDLAEQEARQQGFFRLELYTNVLMTENISLYQGLGYTEVSRLTEKGFNRIYMSKEL